MKFIHKHGYTYIKLYTGVYWINLLILSVKNILILSINQFGDTVVQLYLLMLSTEHNFTLHTVTCSYLTLTSISCTVQSTRITCSYGNLW